MDRRGPTAEEALPAVGVELYSEKNGEMSQIFTDMDLMKGQWRRDEWGYHDAVFLAIIKILNQLSYFYLEIDTLY
jgi:hypothetical protein